MAKQQKTFAQSWDFEDKTRAQEISKYSKYEKAALGASALWALKAGIGGPLGLAAGALWGGGLAIAGKKLTQMKEDFRLDAMVHNSSQDPYLQGMATRLFAKAGLDKKPVVVIIDMPEHDDIAPKSAEEFLQLVWTYEANRQIGVTVNSAFCKHDEALVLIGAKSAAKMTYEEMAAVLAHETAHVIAETAGTSAAQQAYQKASGSFSAGLSVGTMFSKGFIRSLPFSAAGLVRNHAIKEARRSDGDRADRNAVALFPHPTALKTALEKLESAQQTELAESFKENTAAIATLKGFAQQRDIYRTVTNRITAIDGYYGEVTAFYQENGFALDTDYILRGDTGPSKKKDGPKPSP